MLATSACRTKGWDENYQVQQYMLGLKGDIAGSWTFDVFGSVRPVGA